MVFEPVLSPYSVFLNIIPQHTAPRYWSGDVAEVQHTKEGSKGIVLLDIGDNACIPDTVMLFWAFIYDWLEDVDNSYSIMHDIILRIVL